MPARDGTHMAAWGRFDGLLFAPVLPGKANNENEMAASVALPGSLRVLSVKRKSSRAESRTD